MGPPQTSFFTSGERAPHKDSYIIVNQCYVQHLPPLPPPSTPSNPPILFVHGGALTGAQWEVTPDRRPGWASLATRPPFSRRVYIYDNVDHGRSQRAPDALRHGDVLYRTAAEMWDLFRFGPAEGFDARAPFADSQFPVAQLDTLLGSQAARRRTGDAIEARGLGDAVREIGPCHIVAHSHGGTVTLDALKDDEVRALVRRVVLVEPGPMDSAAPVHVPPMLLVWGDHLEEHAMWQELLPSYDGLKAEVWNLPRMGIRGTSHFPMSDRNSDEIGKMVFEWLEESVPA